MQDVKRFKYLPAGKGDTLSNSIITFNSVTLVGKGIV